MVQVRQGRVDVRGQADQHGARLRKEPDQAGSNHEAAAKGGILPTLPVYLLHRTGPG